MSEIKRKLATIERISEILPIPGADAIELAIVRGWQVVVKKGDFNQNDLCIYCEIDSLLPERPEFEFLRNKNFRIRTMKLRGQVSQGIVFPLTILPMSVIYFDTPTGPALDLSNCEGHGLGAIFDMKPGLDLTDVLGVTKYDPPLPACLSGVAKGNFPSHSIKTDEERIQNLISKYDEYRNYIWIESEKLDGSSVTYSIHEDEFGVASRNLALIESEDNSFWKVARKLDVEQKMRDYMKMYGYKSLTIQGELIGEGIQKNKYKLKGQTVRFFRVFDPIAFKFFDYEDSLLKIEKMGLPIVPIPNWEFKLPESYEDLLKYVEGKSLLSDTQREGSVFVAKGEHPRHNGRLSFKVISNKFILKHDA